MYSIIIQKQINIQPPSSRSYILTLTMSQTSINTSSPSCSMPHNIVYGIVCLIDFAFLLIKSAFRCLLFNIPAMLQPPNVCIHKYMLSTHSRHIMCTHRIHDDYKVYVYTAKAHIHTLGAFWCMRKSVALILRGRFVCAKRQTPFIHNTAHSKRPQIEW